MKETEIATGENGLALLLWAGHKKWLLGLKSKVWWSS